MSRSTYSKTNAYTSSNVSIVGAPGTMYNEVTTFNNVHNTYKQKGSTYYKRAGSITSNTNNVHNNKSVRH